MSSTSLRKQYTPIRLQRESKRYPEIRVHVKLPGNASAEIEVHHGDSIHEISRLFCANHDLPTSSVLIVEQHIRDGIAALNKPTPAPTHQYIHRQHTRSDDGAVICRLLLPISKVKYAPVVIRTASDPYDVAVEFGHTHTISSDRLHALAVFIHHIQDCFQKARPLPVPLLIVGEEAKVEWEDITAVDVWHREVPLESLTIGLNDTFHSGITFGAAMRTRSQRRPIGGDGGEFFSIVQHVRIVHRARVFSCFISICETSSKAGNEAYDVTWKQSPAAPRKRQPPEIPPVGHDAPVGDGNDDASAPQMSTNPEDTGKIVTLTKWFSNTSGNAVALSRRTGTRDGGTQDAPLSFSRTPGPPQTVMKAKKRLQDVMAGKELVVSPVLPSPLKTPPVPPGVPEARLLFKSNDNHISVQPIINPMVRSDSPPQPIPSMVPASAHDKSETRPIPMNLSPIRNGDGDHARQPSVKRLYNYVSFVVEGVHEETLPEHSRVLDAFVTKINGVDANSLINLRVVLRKDWYNVHTIIPGTVCNYVYKGPPVLLDEDGGTTEIIINSDDKYRYLIVNPDVLISATTVCDALRCVRRSVIKELARMPPDPQSAGSAGLMGTLCHDLVQRTNANNVSITTLNTVAQALVDEHAIEIWSCGESDVTAMANMTECFVSITQMYENLRKNKKNSCEVLDIEESISSNLFGIKGKIDVTFGPEILPVELKTTGRSGKVRESSGQVDHRAQVIMYTMILESKRNVPVPRGCLVYLVPHLSIHDVEPTLLETRALITHRNDVACRLHELSDRYPPVCNDYNCERCFSRDYCNILHVYLEGHEPSDATECSRSYFADWWCKFPGYEYGFVGEEACDWKHNGSVQVMVERCDTNINAVEVCNRSCPQCPHCQCVNVTHSTSISVDDSVYLSDVNGTVKEIHGRVTSIDAHRYTLSLVAPRSRAALSTGSEYRMDNEQGYFTPMLVRGNLVSLYRNARLRRLIVDLSTPQFVDHDQYPICAGLDPVLVSNVIQSETVNCNKYQCDAIMHTMRARDYSIILGYPGAGKTHMIACLINILARIGLTVMVSSHTHTAVDNALSRVASDIKVLRIGKRSSVSPCNHKYCLPEHTTWTEVAPMLDAVQVIGVTCLGINTPILARKRIDVVIVDEASQILQGIAIGSLLYSRMFVLVGDDKQLPPLVTNKDALERGLGVSLLERLYIAHPEASRTIPEQYRMCRSICNVANEFTYAGALMPANSAVADRKLRPDIRASVGAVTSSVVMTTVVRPRLDTPPSTAPVPPSPLSERDVCSSLSQFITDVLNPDASVVLINVDGLGCNDVMSGSGTGRVNEAEAAVVKCLVHALVVGGIPSSDIGVMSPHRAQIELIKSKISSLSPPPPPPATDEELMMLLADLAGDPLNPISSGRVKLVSPDKVKSSADPPPPPIPVVIDNLLVDTVDRFQGSDREIILVSMVKSNILNDNNWKMGHVAVDEHRLNVAVTRAKSKLIIVCSLSSMNKHPVSQRLVTALTHNGVVIMAPDSLSHTSYYK